MLMYCSPFGRALVLQRRDQRFAGTHPGDGGFGIDVGVQTKCCADKSYTNAKQYRA